MLKPYTNIFALLFVSIRLVSINVLKVLFNEKFHLPPKFLALHLISRNTQLSYIAHKKLFFAG